MSNHADKWPYENDVPDLLSESGLFDSTYWDRASSDTHRDCTAESLLAAMTDHHANKRSASFQGTLEYAKRIILETITKDSQPDWPSGQATDPAFDNLPPMQPIKPFPTTIHTTPEGLAYLLEKHGEGKKQ